jgi:hypothetical protein
LLYILACICAVSCVDPIVITLGSISGVVKDSQSDEILKGVKVTLSPGGVSQLTDRTEHSPSRIWSRRNIPCLL